MGVYTLQQHIHVRDLVDDKVREARVVDLNKDSSYIKIHYHRWNAKHDEWLPEDSDRIISDTNMSDSSDDEFEDANPLVCQQTKEAIGKLLNRIGENCKPIVSAYECKKSIEQNSEIFNDNFKLAQLRDVAQVLNLEIQNKAGKNLLKKVLCRNIAMCINSLMPCKCLQCKGTYATNLDDTPLFRCHLCTRGSHNCTGVTEFKAALPSSLLEGFVWLCVDCVHNGDADSSSSLDEKIVGEKVANAKNESNGNHTQDTSTNPSAVASSSFCANSSHNNANLDADDEEEGGAWNLVGGRKTKKNTKAPQSSVNNINSVQKSSNTKVAQNHRNTDTPQNARNLSSQNANQAQRGICYKYKRGTCPHGLSGNKLVNGNKCKYEHPKLCKYFNTSGAKGCMKGASCTFFHPILCKFSVKHKLCTNINCKFAHLKGTAREAPKEPFRQQPEYEVMKNSNFANVSTNDFLQLKQMVERLYSQLEDRTKHTQMPYHPQVPTYNTYQGPKVQNLGYPMSMPPMYPLVTNQPQQMRQASVFQNNMPPSSC